MVHSIIMPVYNGSRYLLDAARSVLAQIDEKDELIVIDDASTDNTLSMLSTVQDHRLKIIRRTINGGISLTRNDGINASSGDYISLIDHDDLWHPNRHHHVKSIIAAQHDVGVISGMVEHFYSSDLSPTARTKFKLPVTQSATLPGTVTIARHLIEQAGPFDPKLKAGELIDLMSRIMNKKPKWVKSNEIFLLRRIHSNNYTHTHNGIGEAYLSVIWEHLIRQRAGT